MSKKSRVNPLLEVNPQVQGFEEIYRNGQRQVRYWNDPDFLTTHDFLDGRGFNPFRSWGRDLPFLGDDSPTHWHNSSTPRYINPYEVVVEAESPSSGLGGNFWQNAKQGLTRGTRKLGNMVRNIPAALQAAWRTLNQ
ncbi:hypothetical protein PN462_08365 [Spirulina sp. CS-785/01]|uniref:hypothetical protein n=1 Tax=Spirulina sp. CS-785/01 TaxID=3021716 RepID=UPI00232EA87C|nr:hypothetical protein [Spirulina sp. CS-785/01]MDB9313112.1 hypothetical protein [Spirulina sp. CS-785/01]